jgi:hypothetical protein
MREHLAEIRAKYGLPPETEKPPLTLEDVDARIGQWLEQEREFTREVLAAALAQVLNDAENGLIGKVGPRGERGERGPPGKLPPVKIWKEGMIAYADDVVAFDGSTYQARRDTARMPDSESDDWVLIARGGADAPMPHVLGTWKEGEDYRRLAIVAVGGSSFIARCDHPGVCPGRDWQLIASHGKRGADGERGEPGLRGPTGATGPKGEAAPTINSWDIDAASYTATPLMSNGAKGPPLQLRDLFKQFVADSR